MAPKSLSVNWFTEEKLLKKLVSLRARLEPACAELQWGGYNGWCGWLPSLLRQGYQIGEANNAVLYIVEPDGNDSYALPLVGGWKSVYDTLLKLLAEFPRPISYIPVEFAAFCRLEPFVVDYAWMEYGTSTHVIRHMDNPSLRLLQKRIDEWNSLVTWEINPTRNKEPQLQHLVVFEILEFIRNWKPAKGGTAEWVDHYEDLAKLAFSELGVSLDVITITCRDRQGSLISWGVSAPVASGYWSMLANLCQHSEDYPGLQHATFSKAASYRDEEIELDGTASDESGVVNESLRKYKLSFAEPMHCRPTGTVYRDEEQQTGWKVSEHLKELAMSPSSITAEDWASKLKEQS